MLPLCRRVRGVADEGWVDSEEEVTVDEAVTFRRRPIWLADSLGVTEFGRLRPRKKSSSGKRSFDIS